MTWKSFDKGSPENNRENLRKRLTPLQFEVTQEEGTERPFQNEYNDNKREGLYVDVVSGEPLFSSHDKYDSGTGWPSFSRPLTAQAVTERKERRLLIMSRTEVRSALADSHLGHVFPDGPKPTGLRYCMNSAAMRFVPAEELKAQGYGEYLSLFQNKKSQVQVQVAILAGGCFWGMEDLIRAEKGVLDTEVGYTGGKVPNASYEQVKKGGTGHAESIRIEFDPAATSYGALLRFFFKIHDPTTVNRQGNDVGSQYRSAIFYRDEEQRETAEKIKAEVERSGFWKKPLVTEIVAAGEFYSAEGYHQDYLKKNPGGYTCHFIR